MTKLLSNPKVFAATAVLFVAASIFNVYAGAAPTPSHGLVTAPVVKMLDTRTGIGPMMPPAEPYCPRPDSCLDK